MNHVFDMHLSICNVSGGETCKNIHELQSILAFY